ncbi:MAG: LLM class flavin-dependent oxidoreductase [Nitrososphaerota archaeon]
MAQQYVSIALECDKPPEFYRQIASIMDGAGFYSLQLYEHLPYRPAWAIAFQLQVRHLKVGPVTVPARLYRPQTLARYMAHLHSTTGGALLGISRGAYMGGERAGISEVVETVARVVGEMRRIGWAPPFQPEIYVGTSGPKLARAAAASHYVKALVVDNLANQRYAEMLRRWLDEAGRRDLPIIARPFTSISRNRDEAEQLALRELRKYLPDLVGPSPMLAAAGLTPSQLTQDDTETQTRLLQNFAIHGDIEDTIEKMYGLFRSGVSHICLGHPLGPKPLETVKLVAEKIIPYMAQIKNG